MGLGWKGCPKDAPALHVADFPGIGTSVVFVYSLPEKRVFIHEIVDETEAGFSACVCRHQMLPATRLLIFLRRHAGFSSPHGPGNCGKKTQRMRRYTGGGENRRRGRKPDVLGKGNKHLGCRGRYGAVLLFYVPQRPSPHL